MLKPVTMGAIILAGGESSRMGFDKALLPFEGRTLLEDRILKALPFFEEIYVVVENVQKVEGLKLMGAKVCEDMIPKAGPLAGLYTGLCRSRYNWNMVFTVDMPFVDDRAVFKLIQAADENSADAHCFEMPGGEVHPFPGIYDKQTRSWARLLIDQNVRALHRFFQVIDCRKIAWAGEERIFTNLNHSEEYWKAMESNRKCVS